MTDIFLEMLKYSIPALFVLIGTWLTIRAMLNYNEKIRAMELSLQRSEIMSKQFQETLPLRLQAYERLLLYLERISPTQIINRTRMEDMTVPELQMTMVATIRMEFEHNLTQQLYISPDAWEMIRNVTEESISIINNIASNMNTDANGNDFSRALLNFYLENGQTFPSLRAALVLKSEAMQLFG